MRRAAAGIAAAAVLLAVLGAARPAAALPAGGRPIGAAQAERIARHDPKVVEERRRNGVLKASASMVDGNWEVAWFAGESEVAVVILDPATGKVRESWTGYQVAWKMARGYPGAFGHRLNAPYVFLPLCALFLLGLVDWRRLRRPANFDLLVLLGFGVSNFFFNRAEIGLSVPLAYPVLLYLLARMLWIGFRGTGGGLRPVWPAAWLLVAALFLMGVRVGLNVSDSGVIDVGYASEVGADRIVHGEQLYGNFPEDVQLGDTYGPVNYLAYVPADLIWPWSGSWNDLPAAHGSAVLFDVAAFGLLFLLGLRIRPGPGGRALGATLAFGWAAYPYTAYALESNSNDTLVAVLLIAVLLALSRPMLRGALASLATLSKFAPGLLVPMLATYSPSAGGMDDRGVEDSSARSAPRSSMPGPAVVSFVLAFAAVTLAILIWPAIDPGLRTFYDRTIAYQAGRDSPFSVWGQVGLEPLRITIMVAVGVLSLLLAFRPRRKSLTQVAALGAALLIGAQLTAQHWFYLYIVWFFPLAFVALGTVSRPAPDPGRDRPREPSPARSRPPARAR